MPWKTVGMLSDILLSSHHQMLCKAGITRSDVLSQQYHPIQFLYSRWRIFTYTDTAVETRMIPAAIKNTS